MITGTPWSPPKSLLVFAGEFVRKIAVGDFAGALQGLDADASGTRWRRSELEAHIRSVLGAGALTPPQGMKDSPKATCSDEGAGEIYTIEYPLPIDRRWSSIVVVLRFTKRRGEYFSVSLEGVRQR